MNSASTHKNPDFWIFGLFFFLYFFIMATCFPFLPVWLSDVVGLSKTDTGIVFSCLSLFAISFQPLLGVISDRLGLKKNLIWSISLLLVFFAPFFLYVFAPLLRFNIWAGALTGGVFIGFVFSAGAGAIEAYIERVSRSRGFEYGKARMFGCLGWALCATMAGMLFNVDPGFLDGVRRRIIVASSVVSGAPQYQPDGNGYEYTGCQFFPDFDQNGLQPVSHASDVDVCSLHDWCGLCL